MLPLIPVIDIRLGIAVHAIAGDRTNYKPLRSSIVSGVEPASIVRQLAARIPSLQKCYIADLDAIEGRSLNRCTMAELVRVGMPLLVDAGSSNPGDVEELLDLGVQTVVVSSESCSDLEGLRRIARQFDAGQVCASIDLKAGELLTRDPAWVDRTALDLASHIVASGINQTVVLDLKSVGTSRGIPTLDLCKSICDQFPELAVITGGGVHSWSCLQDAEEAGVNGVLVGSALHDGRLDLRPMT